MTSSLDDLLRQRLELLEQQDLRRELRASDDPALLNFGANDYLGLARHPALTEAARAATARLGTGAGASRLVTGTDTAVLDLEASLASWKEKEAALVFSSGYAAALGTLPALVGRGDTVVLDKLAHACLIDGARLSGAQVRTFPHNDLDRLEGLLRTVSAADRRTLVVTESLFSMDGDFAPLRDLVEIKNRFGAWLLVDEAHATGLYGATGAGLVAEAGLGGQVDVLMGTMSKALGSVGGYIAGSRVLIDWLTNRARSFVYSTALPPGAIAASQVAIGIARGPDGSHLRALLQVNVARFRDRLSVDWRARNRSRSAIQPLICGEPAAALQLSATLRARGFLVPAIRAPSVPLKAARLRVTLSAAHTSAHIDSLNQALQDSLSNIRTR